MVEEVENVQSELQTDSLSNLPVLLQREVGGDEFGSMAIAERFVTHGSNCLADYREGGGVVDIRPTGSSGATTSRDGRTPVRTRSPRRTLVARAVKRVQTQWRSHGRQCGEVFR